VDCHRTGLSVFIPCNLSGAQGLAIRSTLECGLSRGYSCCDKLQYLSVELRTWVNSSTRHFPSVCCDIGKFLRLDFLGVRHIRDGLLRPKLYTNGLSWHTISWYYPFLLIKQIKLKRCSKNSKDKKYKVKIFPFNHCHEYKKKFVLQCFHFKIPN
jgi:hypothetical protein